MRIEAPRRIGFDPIVLALRGWTQACIDSGNRHALQGGDHVDRLGGEEAERLGVDGRAVPILLFLSGRANQDVAENRAREHDAFGVFVRNWQDDRAQERGSRLIENHELALADGSQIRFAQQSRLEVIGEQAGAIDHGPRLDRSFRRAQAPDAVRQRAV